MATKKPLTLGALIDALDDAREVKRAIAAEAKLADAAYKDLEAKVFEALRSQDTRGGEGKKASASISESIVPVYDAADPEARDKLKAFIKRTGYWHLLSETVSAPAYRELLEIPKFKGVVPGLVPFTKHTLNLRSLPASK
jgi:hypothetical protein